MFYGVAFLQEDPAAAAALRISAIFVPCVRLLLVPYNAKFSSRTIFVNRASKIKAFRGSNIRHLRKSYCALHKKKIIGSYSSRSQTNPREKQKLCTSKVWRTTVFIHT